MLAAFPVYITSNYLSPRVKHVFAYHCSVGCCNRQIGETTNIICLGITQVILCQDQQYFERAWTSLPNYSFQHSSGSQAGGREAHHCFYCSGPHLICVLGEKISGFSFTPSRFSPKGCPRCPVSCVSITQHTPHRLVLPAELETWFSNTECKRSMALRE